MSHESGENVEVKFAFSALILVRAREPFLAGECVMCSFFMNGTIIISWFIGVLIWIGGWVVRFSFLVSIMVPFFGGILSRAVKDLLVPLSERRHRLYKHEIPEVIAALRLYLEKQAETRENVEKAETAYRILHRLTTEKQGKPKYPKFSWEYLEHYVDSHEK